MPVPPADTRATAAKLARPRNTRHCPNDADPPGPVTTSCGPMRQPRVSDAQLIDQANYGRDFTQPPLSARPGPAHAWAATVHRWCRPPGGWDRRFASGMGPGRALFSGGRS
jgi:hypothetical protein